VESRSLTTDRRRVDTFILRILAALSPGLIALVAAGVPAQFGANCHDAMAPMATAGNWKIALTLAAGLVAGTWYQTWRQPGSLATRLTVASAVAAFCVLSVHFGGGGDATHFFSIAALALLVYYRDWRPIALCGTLIALAYTIAYPLQNNGWPITVFACPDYATVATRVASAAGIGVLLCHVAESMGKDEDAIRRMADIDALTGLPNRRHFHETLRHALYWSERSGCRLAVLYLDLDYFKRINDALGHEAGDILLKHVAAQASATLRSGDQVARLGGDEFAAILNNLKCADDAIRVAEKLMSATRLPIVLGGHLTEVSASLGIALYPDHAGTMENLLRCADVALYRAKQAGRNTYCLFASR